MIMWGKMMVHCKSLVTKLIKRINRKGSLMERFVDNNFHTALKLSYGKDIPLVKPITAVISILNRCNSRCVYCNAWKIQDENDATTEEWLDVVKQLSSFGIREVVFSGGEPLLSGSLECIVKASNNLGIITHVVTNGILLSKERMYLLIKAGIKGITVSVDSLKEAEYSATRGVSLKYASRALDVLFEYKKLYPDLYAGINVVVTAKNLTAYPNLINKASDRGVYVAFQSYTSHPSYILQDLLPSEETEELFNSAIRYIKSSKNAGKLVATSIGYLDGIIPFMKSRSLPADFKCLAGYLGVNIDPGLTVVPCWNMPPVGNLREASLEDIWYSDKFYEARMRMLKLDCQKCWILCHTDVESMTRRSASKRAS